MSEQAWRLESHLAQVHVAVGRLAVAVHPQGQNQRQGEDAEREQGVHQHVQHGRDSRRRLDFHCGRETLTASQRYHRRDCRLLHVPHQMLELLCDMCVCCD